MGPYAHKRQGEENWRKWVGLQQFLTEEKKGRREGSFLFFSAALNSIIFILLGWALMGGWVQTGLLFIDAIAKGIKMRGTNLL